MRIGGILCLLEDIKRGCSGFYALSREYCTMGNILNIVLKTSYNFERQLRNFQIYFLNYYQPYSLELRVYKICNELFE